MILDDQGKERWFRLLGMLTVQYATVSQEVMDLSLASGHWPVEHDGDGVVSIMSIPFLLDGGTDFVRQNATWWRSLAFCNAVLCTAVYRFGLLGTTWNALDRSSFWWEVRWEVTYGEEIVERSRSKILTTVPVAPSTIPLIFSSITVRYGIGVDHTGVDRVHRTVKCIHSP
jgi:hypothetical protein